MGSPLAAWCKLKTLLIGKQGLKVGGGHLVLDCSSSHGDGGDNVDSSEC